MSLLKGNRSFSKKKRGKIVSQIIEQNNNFHFTHNFDFYTNEQIWNIFHNQTNKQF